MDLVELHIIQSFPVTCLNRDDLGSPKSAVFGGVQRARVSSQCWKRAIREAARESKPDLFAGVRSRLVGPEVVKTALAIGASESVASACSKVVCAVLGKDDKTEGLVKTLLYFSPQSLNSLTRAVVESGKLTDDVVSVVNSQEAKKSDKAIDALLKDKDLAKILKKLGESVGDAADIALFGRMVADDSTQTVEGAAMFSHALSTHSVRNDLDFFSAVDDCKVDSDDAGAGHIGSVEFNSACYYRYVGINLDLLRQSRLFNQSELKVVLDSFIRACVTANPVARRNAMFGYTLPSCVLALRRKGQPLSLANAFEKPVRAGKEGIVEGSIAAMESEWQSLKGTFGLSSKKEVKVAKGAETLDGMIAAVLEDIV